MASTTASGDIDLKDLPQLVGKERHELLYFLALQKEKGEPGMVTRIAEIERHLQVTEEERAYLEVEVVAHTLVQMTQKSGLQSTTYIRGPKPASFQ